MAKKSKQCDISTEAALGLCDNEHQMSQLRTSRLLVCTQLLNCLSGMQVAMTIRGVP